MRVKILLSSISLLFAFTACRQQTAAPNQALQSSANRTANAALNDAVSPPVSPTAAAPSDSPDKAKIRTFDGKGVVTKINLEIVSVELKHEEIKGLMPAMQMEFHVAEKSQLEKLKVGDQVDFVLEDNQGAEQITRIKKAK